MNVADLDALVKFLSDPDLKKVLEHPDWPAAYSALTNSQYENNDGFDDLDSDAQFVQVVSSVTLWVHEGKLWSEDNSCPNGGYAWVGDEWVMGDDLEEESDADE
jgi:hypothetical protein